MKKVSASGLQVRLDKCKFVAPSVTYLGHRIDSEGLNPIEEKIRAIRDVPALRNVTVLKVFLGLFQFYSRDVLNIADELGPLYYLLQNGVSWKCETDHSLAFQKAKESLQANRVLVHYGIGAVLSHIMTNGSEMYKLGINIVAADTMSHTPLQENVQFLMLGCIIHLIDHLDDITVDSTDIRRRTSKDPVYQAVQSGTNLPEEPLYSVFHTKRYELSIENGCLFWRFQVIIPHTLR